ncbi:DUF4825 domain-containing protein [Falsibacillus pallidus]|uniref:Uncharacterized protein DUF4825 n=1 Tax=Falsibacillus pallidus TaxID=493781 RepID=A0A370GR72_9BACI|nr:DUF4825 domain-containing protein [Falsibacillus pallidus]RDI45746.1 uncharacterized protein DUF4825 [Falsibacillus pallidus]
MMHRETDARLESRLKNLPKPSLSDREKGQMLNQILNTESKPKRTWKFTPVIVQAAAGLATLFIIVLIGMSALKPVHHNGAGSETGTAKHFAYAGETMNLYDLSKLQTPYVGNNSKVIQIAHSLPGGGLVKEISLQTKTASYGVTITYASKNSKQFDAFTQSGLKDKMLTNAAACLILIDNADQVKMIVETDPVQTYEYTRSELEKTFGRDLSEYTKNPKLWKKEIYDN